MLRIHRHSLELQSPSRLMEYNIAQISWAKARAFIVAKDYISATEGGS